MSREHRIILVDDPIEQGLLGPVRWYRPASRSRVAVLTAA
jgi:hypothetical protein